MPIEIAIDDLIGLKNGTMKVLPIEPTEEMKQAAHSSTAAFLNLQGSGLSQALQKHGIRYKAMCSGSPAPSGKTIRIPEGLLDGSMVVVSVEKLTTLVRDLVEQQAIPDDSWAEKLNELLSGTNP